MAASNDDILSGITVTNKLMQELLDQFINNGTPTSSRGGSGSYFSKSVESDYFDKDDFDRRIEKYKRAISGKDERTRDDIKKDIIKSDRKILELEDEINEILEERNELVDKQKNDPNGLSEDEAERLAELNGKIDEHNNALKENIGLRRELDRTPTGFEKVMGVVGKVTSGIKAIYNEANKLAEPWNRLDSAASKYARSVGMAGDAYKKFRDTSLRNIDQNKLSTSSGLKPEEIINAQLSFVKATGRNVRVDNKTQSDVAHMSKLLGDGGLSLAASLDKFGLGMADVAELTTEMFNDASKYGISFEEYTQNVSKNLNIAQNYTFKNGIKGLESMAKKSTAIKLDMQQIANLANQVSSVEGAVQTSAKLQVLGGPFAQLADPMGMLNEGLNDMEGLFDRVSKMVGNLGGFNKETGEVEVSSYNKRRIRAAAEAMGMDYGQLMESVNTQARRNEIGRQISSSASLSGLDEELKELIKNTASFKDGKAGVTTANGEFKALEGLSGSDAEALKEELKLQNQTKEQDIKSIVQSTKGAQEALEGMKAQIDARQASMLGWLGKILKWGHTLVGITSGILTTIVAIKALNSIGNIANAFTGGKGNIARSIGKKLEGFGGSAAQGAGNSIGRRTLGGIKNIGVGALKGVKNVGIGALKGVKNVGIGALKGVKSVGVGVLKGVKSVGGGVFKDVKNVGGGAVKGVKNIVGSAFKSAKNVGGSIIKSVKNVSGSAFKGAKNVVGSVLKNVKNVGGGTFKGVKNVGGSILKSVKNVSGGTFKGTKNVVGNVLKSVKNVSGGTFKGTKNVVGNVLKSVKKVGGGAFKGVKSVSGKTISKIGAKLGPKALGIAGRLGKAAAAGGGLASIATVVGEIGNIATDSLVKKGKIKKGGGANIAMSAGSNALAGAGMGAMIGSIVPGIGTAIGAVVGGAIGAVRGFAKSGAIKKAVRKLSETKVGRAIGKAKEKFDNTKIGQALDKFKDSKIYKYSPMGITNKLTKKFLGLDSDTTKSIKPRTKSADVLDKYTGKIKPVAETGSINASNEVVKSNKEVHIKTDPHDIKLNGTLNLRGENGQTIDLMKELKNNPRMMRQLTEMISSEMGVLAKGGVVAQGL